MESRFCFCKDLKPCQWKIIANSTTTKTAIFRNSAGSWILVSVGEENPEIEIKYCPLCGRELKVEQDDPCHTLGINVYGEMK